MESSLDASPEQGDIEFVFLCPGTWEDCEVDQMWEKEVVEALPKNSPTPLFTYMFMQALYSEIIFYLSYNVFDMKLWSAPQSSIITTLTNNGAITMNTLLQGIKWESKNWHTHFKLHRITMAQNPVVYEWNKDTLFITQALGYSHAQHDTLDNYGNMSGKCLFVG